jgi:hypothetical protein
MRGTIISFTAGQNVAAFLNMNSVLAHLTGNPLTNQFCFWALDQMPFLNYMAWPVANASKSLQSLSSEAPAALNPVLARFDGTQLVWKQQVGKLVLQNMNMFAPSLAAVTNEDGQFLFLSAFPSSSKGKPAPESLLAQVAGRTNLVYYDWELTGRRLSEWQILGGMIANRAGLQESDPEVEAFDKEEWIAGLCPLAVNTVTEITRFGSNELSFQRKAPLGFTAVELVLLVDWLCDANSGPIHSPPAAGRGAPFPGHP